MNIDKIEHIRLSYICTEDIHGHHISFTITKCYNCMLPSEEVGCPTLLLHLLANQVVESTSMLGLKPIEPTPHEYCLHDHRIVL